jgi:hypothetical protein
MNYKILKGVSIDLAVHRVILEELDFALQDELFTDITDDEIYAISKSAVKLYRTGDGLTMRGAAELIAENMVKYISELPVDSISVKDLLELMAYEGLA